MEDYKIDNEFTIKSNKGKSKSGSIFSWLEKWMRLENYFTDGFPIQYLPKVLFIMVLGLFYISNTHHAEKTVRKINQLQVEVEDLRADYTTLKADLMFASKQSEVAKKVKQIGLEENVTPPQKIMIQKGEY